MLVGLLLNSTLGWWWADPVAGLVLAVLALREARNAWRGDLCCAPATTHDGCGGTCDESPAGRRPAGGSS